MGLLDISLFSRVFLFWFLSIFDFRIVISFAITKKNLAKITVESVFELLNDIVSKYSGIFSHIIQYR